MIEYMTQNKPELLDSWQGMSCKICSRFQWELDGYDSKGKPIFKPRDTCDLMGTCQEFNYCCLFKPSAKKVKTKEKILNMWNDHMQRWIREAINF